MANVSLLWIKGQKGSERSASRVFIHVEKVQGDRKLMYSVKVLTSPVKETCLKVQVVDPLL